MSVSRLFAALALVIGSGVSPAHADVLFTPFVGGNFGGSADAPLADAVAADQSRTTFGGSLALMSGGIFGVEADLGYTPKFFGTDVEVAGIPIDVAGNNVLTAMVNLTAGIPLQGSSGAGIRPYAVGGVGLIRQRFEVAGGLFGYSANDVGYNVGGGVMLFFAPNVGIRGDVRHFRSLSGDTIIDLLDLDLGTFNFTRATVGVTFRY